MKAEELMDIALKAGEILVVSGAEVYRIEDTIFNIFKSYDIECDCFVLLSVIFITAVDENNHTISRMKTIKEYSFDLRRIELVNSFSRSLRTHPLEYEEALKILDSIARAPRHNFKTRMIAAGMTAFVNVILFKGGIGEAMAAFPISMLIYYVREKIYAIGFFQFFQFFVSGFIAGAMSLISSNFFSNLDAYKILIGSIMILVPGMAITTGLKDALYGDIVSSLYRLAEAAFSAVAVGSGVGAAFALGAALR